MNIIILFYYLSVKYYLFNTYYCRNNDDDDTSSSSTDDTDTNNAQPSRKNQTQLSYTNLINDLLEKHPNAEYGHFESYTNAV